MPALTFGTTALRKFVTIWPRLRSVSTINPPISGSEFAKATTTAPTTRRTALRIMPRFCGSVRLWAICETMFTIAGSNIGKASAILSASIAHSCIMPSTNMPTLFPLANQVTISCVISIRPRRSTGSELNNARPTR